MDEYLDNIREIERRITRIEQQNASGELRSEEGEELLNSLFERLVEAREYQAEKRQYGEKEET